MEKDWKQIKENTEKATGAFEADVLNTEKKEEDKKEEEKPCRSHHTTEASSQCSETGSSK